MFKSPFRTSTLKDEGYFQVSKWLSHQILLDVNEMQNLLEELGDFHICSAGQLYSGNEGIISKEQFLICYQAYLDGIKQGKLIDESIYRTCFSSVLTTSLDHLYKVEVSQDQYLLRISKPVLQLQTHRMHYSKLDGKFRPMIFGTESIMWGIQFSYPQIFQDNTTKEILSVLNNPEFPNGKLYQALQKWIRKNTIPTPFIADEKLINSPIRIGKDCLPWINQHPQLLQRGLKVGVS